MQLLSGEDLAKAESTVGGLTVITLPSHPVCPRQKLSWGSFPQNVFLSNRGLEVVGRVGLSMPRDISIVQSHTCLKLEFWKDVPT